MEMSLHYQKNPWLNDRKKLDLPNARIVLLKVIDAERSTSPPYIAVYIFDAPPPGAEPVASKPIAVDESNFAIFAKVKAI